MPEEPFDLSMDVNVMDNAYYLIMHEWTCLFCSNLVLSLFRLIWFQTKQKDVVNSPDYLINLFIYLI